MKGIDECRAPAEPGPRDRSRYLLLVGGPFRNDLGFIAILQDGYRIFRFERRNDRAGGLPRLIEAFHLPHLAAGVHNDKDVSRHAADTRRLVKNVILGNNEIRFLYVTYKAAILVERHDIEFYFFGPYTDGVVIVWRSRFGLNTTALCDSSTDS